MRAFIVICVTAVTMLGCESATGIDVSGQSALNRHQAQWQRAGLRNYSFDYTEQILAITYRKHIAVLNDVVANVTDIGSDYDGGPEQSWPTVNELFARARQDLNRKGLDVTIQYDSKLGYPTEFTVRQHPANPGGGFHASVAHVNSTPLEIPAP